MPAAPPPEVLKSDTDRLKDLLQDPRFNTQLRDWLKLRLSDVSVSDSIFRSLA